MKNYWHEIGFTSSRNIKAVSGKKMEYINTDTGEVIKGYVGEHASLDAKPFIKVLSGSLSLKSQMNSSGRTVYFMLEWLIQCSKDSSFVILDKESMREYIKFINNDYPDFSIGLTTLYRGISNLTDLDVIRQGRRVNEYQVNPEIIFNGSRIKAFNKEKDY